MREKFSKLFHQESKNTFEKLQNALPQEEWPQEWLTTYYKTYSRFPQKKLPDISPHSADFFSLIKDRKSERSFSSNDIALEDLSLLLRYSCGETGSVFDKKRVRRAQPSAGARFPIETYLFVFQNTTSIPAGIYHYNVHDHALETLLERRFSDEELKTSFAPTLLDLHKNASVGIVLSAVFWRNQNKYKERGYRQILIEAGHIGQNLYLCSAALGLKCCAISGTLDDEVERLLDIDYSDEESVIYTLLIGS